RSRAGEAGWVLAEGEQVVVRIGPGGRWLRPARRRAGRTQPREEERAGQGERQDADGDRDRERQGRPARRLDVHPGQHRRGQWRVRYRPSPPRAWMRGDERRATV